MGQPDAGACDRKTGHRGRRQGLRQHRSSHERRDPGFAICAAHMNDHVEEGGFLEGPSPYRREKGEPDRRIKGELDTQSPS